MADLKQAIKSTIASANSAMEPSIEAIKSTIHQTSQALGEGVDHARSYVGDQAQNATGTISEGLKTAAGAIRENVPEDGPLGQAARGVAQSFSNTAGYLDREGLSGIGDGLASFIKSNPISAMLVGVSLGFLLARGIESKR